MVEYRKSYLNKIKSFLSNLIEFFKDNSVLLKEYLDNCAVIGPDQKPIIMIRNNKIFFLQIIIVKKYKLLIVKAFCDQKKRKKNYICRFYIIMIKIKSLIFII